MPRKHTVWDAEIGEQVDILFTPEEETARDIEEAAWLIDKAARDVRDARYAVLEGKIVDGTATLPEFLEMWRLEHGVQ